MKKIGIILFASYVFLLIGCKRSTPQATIPNTDHSTFPRQTFVTVAGSDQITLISPNECEIGGGREILLGEYSRQGDKLRLVLKAMGTNVVQYYDITPEGLRDSRSGQTFLTPELAAKERQRLRQAADDAERARVAAEQAKQKAERERMDAAERQHAIALKELEARLTPLVRKGQKFKASFSKTLPYQITAQEDLQRETKDNSIILSARAVLSPQPGPDGKIHLQNYYDEGKGHDDVSGWIRFVISSQSLDVRLEVEYQNRLSRPTETSSQSADYHDESEITFWPSLHIQLK